MFLNYMKHTVDENFLLLKFLCFEVNILYIIFHFYSNEMIFEFSLKMRGTLHISTKLLYF